MLAAARHGIKSKYGLGNRLWNIVAESDITGILTLPKSKRYFPMVAGVLVDIFSISVTTILIQNLLQHNARPFVIQVCQAVVLENVIAIAWQFNIFVKTDVYYIICNYLSYLISIRTRRTICEIFCAESVWVVLAPAPITPVLGICP